MPLFRFHRPSLEESLKTTIIVKTFNDVVKAIVFDDSFMAEHHRGGAIFSVQPYPDEANNFDKRIGWFTQIVTVNLYKEDEMVPIGFLSEPFGEN